MSLSDVADWLTLSRVPGLGPATFDTLLRHFGSAGDALRASPAELRHCGIAEAVIAGLCTPDRGGVEQDLAWAARPGHAVLRLCDAGYPTRLRNIARPPPVLFVSGDLSCLDDPQIAIVGSRHPTAAGRKNAHDFAGSLARLGLTITSGLAVGVDGASHAAALAAGGCTIAVAATGPDRTYPARHRDLARQITAHGAIISEFPTGVRPKPENFPRRNRLISGLSLGVLVVEAAHQSGSLITARWAAEQGRDVFAIPGSIHNPLAKGCHQLIQEGARLVESAQGILEELGAVVELKPAPALPANEPAESALDKTYQQLLNCLGFEPMSVDEIVERSGLTVDTVSSMLLILELKGLIAAEVGGHYTRLTPGTT